MPSSKNVLGIKLYVKFYTRIEFDNAVINFKCLIGNLNAHTGEFVLCNSSCNYCQPYMVIISLTRVHYIKFATSSL